MDNKTRYIDDITLVKGSVVGIVYVFENENAEGYEHYDIWRSDVICSWMTAIQELRCVPFILDARTFVSKAMNHSLPKIDYVVNLNNGNYKLSTLGLIPSVCGFLSIPCIPCNTLTIMTGESKSISNAVAIANNMTVPKTVNEDNASCIVRPDNLGSSIGVCKSYYSTSKDFTEYEMLHQEFISGFDMTSPILYNPLTCSLEVLQPIMYYPDKEDIEWFLGSAQKAAHSGYQKRPIQISEEVKQQYIRLAKAFKISTYCRIDARIKCMTSNDMKRLSKETVSLSDVYFLELNPMPTVKEGINFHDSITHLAEETSMYTALEIYKNTVENSSLTGFMLCNSIIALKSITKR